MPILVKLVAVCAACSAQHEYESEVKHRANQQGDLLQADGIEHEVDPPTGWGYRPGTFWCSFPLLCPKCYGDDP